MKANPAMIEKLASRNKCWMCKHKFDKPVLLPVDTLKQGEYQPNVNVEVLFHMSDTHGLPAETVREWIIGAVYGMELVLTGIRGVQHD